MQNHKQQPESGTPSVQPQAQGEPKFTSGEGTKAQRHEGTEGAEIELTPAELAFDIPAMLRQNDAAIEILKKAGLTLPRAAFEMQTVLRRCVHAESVKAELLKACQGVLWRYRCLAADGYKTLAAAEEGREEEAAVRVAIAKAGGAA